MMMDEEGAEGWGPEAGASSLCSPRLLCSEGLTEQRLFKAGELA